jgi:hypothetical protein
MIEELEKRNEITNKLMAKNGSELFSLFEETINHFSFSTVSKFLEGKWPKFCFPRCSTGTSKPIEGTRSETMTSH